MLPDFGVRYHNHQRRRLITQHRRVRQHMAHFRRLLTYICIKITQFLVVPLKKFDVGRICSSPVRWRSFSRAISIFVSAESGCRSMRSTKSRVVFDPCRLLIDDAASTASNSNAAACSARTPSCACSSVCSTCHAPSRRVNLRTITLLSRQATDSE